MDDKCPWCDGTDRSFRPLRFGVVSCNNAWHNADAQRANLPCKKHNHIHPCPYCKIEALENKLARIQRITEE